MQNPFLIARITTFLSTLPRGLALFVVVLLSGCAQLNPLNWFSSSGPKPVELQEFKPTLSVRQQWSVSIGKAGGFAFQPALVDGQVYAAAADGTLTRVDLSNGRVVWRVEAKSKLSAGVGSDGKVLAVGNLNGDVLVFDAENGNPRWQARVSSEIIAPPVVAADLVLVRSVDGRITALDSSTGKRRWIYQRPLPVLTLRTGGGMYVTSTTAYAGFPGGKLLALSVVDGAPRWEATVANPKGVTELERIADVTGTPQVQGKDVCAASYQGRVACFDINSGELRWSREVSSANGLELDLRYVFVADEVGQVFTYARQAGSSVWRQEKLGYRALTQPLSSDRSVVVGDVEGVVHWLSREEGAFIARARTDGTPILAAPRLLPKGVLIQTTGGTLVAFSYE